MAIHSFEYVVGATFVALYAFERINTPKISQEATTPSRYWSMVLAYSLASILLYFVLSMSLSLVGIQTLKTFQILPPDSFKETSPPVLMALLLTVLLSKIPGLSKLDEAVRREFRHRASMSRIAGNLSHLLERSPLRLSPQQQAEIIATLKEQGIGPENAIFIDNRSVQYTWTRVSVLLVALRGWKSNPDYNHFVNAFRGEWDKLIEDAEHSEAKAIRCFRLGNVPGDDAALSSALKDCRHHYSEQLDELLKQLSDFMGRGIAHVCGNRPERLRQHLTEIGLDVRSGVGYTAHQIAFVIMVALVVSIFLPLLINLVSGEDFRVGPYVFKVVAGYTIAALVVLRLHYHPNRPKNDNNIRPWGRYLTAGLVTLLLVIPFVLIYDTLIKRDVAEVFNRFIHFGYVYQLRPLVLAVLLAYLIDTQVTPERRRLRQWQEMGISAVCMAAASGAIVLLLGAIKLKHPEYQVRVPDTEVMILSAAVLGALIGYWLPSSTRTVAERAPDRRGSSVQSGASVSGTS